MADNRQQQHNNIDLNTHTFLIPRKELTKPEQITLWENSQAYADLLGFICAMNDAVRNKKIRDEYHVSSKTEKLIALLETMDKWIEAFPPVEQPQRFGNKAFKQFYEKCQEETPSLLLAALDPQYHKCIPEVAVYLCESFGNSTRIDYGTGHELAFIAFLCCLYKIGYLIEEDAVATVLRTFNKYIELCQKLQRTYRMEPAGSHGVWSLDDYQFIPFLWGSSQLVDNRRIEPRHFPEEDYYQGFFKDYMFLSCIRYICSVKTGPFAEHSNQLWNISGVPLWSKVNSGLIKMYKAELLNKFPVIQHVLFGSLLTLLPEKQA